FRPGPLVKRLSFHEYTPSNNHEGNHVCRGLDQSWRVGEVPANTTGVRTAILFGKLARADGPADPLLRDNDARLASHLWLGELPSSGNPRPYLPGQLTHETYVRVFIPVRPE